MNTTTLSLTSVFDTATAQAQEFTRKQVDWWLDQTNQFFHAERETMLKREATAEDVRIHRVWCSTLLRLGHGLQGMAIESLLMDSDSSRWLSARMTQLEAAWRLFQEARMTEAEADEIIARYFPDEPRP